MVILWKNLLKSHRTVKIIVGEKIREKVYKVRQYIKVWFTLHKYNLKLTLFVIKVYLITEGVDSRNVRTPVREMSIPLSPFSPPWSPSFSSPSWEQQSKNLLMNFHPRNICKQNPRYPTSFFKQVSILILRNLRMLTRDRVLTYMRFFIHLSIAALMGILYFQIGNEAQYMRDNFNFIFFTVMFLMFTAFNSMALSCKYYTYFT